VRSLLPAIAILLSSALPLVGQQPAGEARISVEITPVEATIGDRLQSRIAIELPAGAEADAPDLEGSLDPFTVVSGTWQRSEEQEGANSLVWTGELTVFTTGELELPSLAVSYSHDGNELSVESEAVPITIRSLLAEEAEGEQAELSDLKPPVSMPADYGPLSAALLILSLLLAAAALLWWLHRRYAHKLAAASVPEDPFHRMPPHLWVYKALQELLERRLEQQGLIDVFYAELSSILKRYLGGRYRVDLMEKTTEESPGMLRQAGAPERAITDMRELLGLCDGVKFAKDKPAPNLQKEAVETLYRIVDVTKPVESERREPERGAA
jgi:hypothetical protein